MTPVQVRILVVEDERQWQVAIRQAFEELGCVVDVVDNNEDALRKLNDNTYHLMTIDNQLFNKEKGDLDTHEGLRLADILHQRSWFGPYKALHSAVITSVDKGVKLVRDMLARFEVDYYFPKEIEDDYRKEMEPGGTFHELIEVLKHPPQVVIEAPEPEAHLNGIKVEWETYWPYAESLPVPADELNPPPEDELAARKALEFQLLFQRLFPNIESIALKPILKGYSATQVFEAYYQIKGANFPVVIVKVGSYHRISMEYNNFLDYVSNRLMNVGIRVVVDNNNRGFARTQLLAGLVYTFVGTPDAFTEFGTFYADTPHEEFSRIERVLNHLFEVNCAFWYQPGMQEQQRVSMYAIYDEMLNLDKYAGLVRTALRDLENSGLARIGEQKIEFDFAGIAYPNVVASLLQSPVLQRMVRLGVSHGDLNENNIRVNPVTHNAWLIDFQRTGQHHALRDFIQLEMVVKLILLQIGDIADYHAMEQVLLSSDRFDNNSLDGLRDRYDPPNDDYAKAFDTILHIRRLAASKVPAVNHYEDYFVGLVLYTYSALRLFKEVEGQEIAQAQNATQQLAALLSTCMLGDMINVY